MKKIEGYHLNTIIDPAMREMYQVVHDAAMTNVFDRFSEQQPIQCKFCIEGLSCQLCANGPCRISPKAPRGVCGVDAHTMVARNFVYLPIGQLRDKLNYHCRRYNITFVEQNKEYLSPISLKVISKLP